jgi:hypothetical protein
MWKKENTRQKDETAHPKLGEEVMADLQFGLPLKHHLLGKWIYNPYPV